MNLKDINLKRHGNTIIKVLTDMKVLGLFALMGFTLYGIGWDTVLRPSLEQLKQRDEALLKQQQTLTERKNLQSQYGEWEKQLQGLTTHLIAMSPNDSPKIISVSEQAQLQDLATGKLRDETVLPKLMPPHDQRTNVSLTSTGDNGGTTFDILNPEGTTPPAEQSSTTTEQPIRGAEATTPATSLPVSRFNFDLKLTGTYPALVDFINELIIRDKLVKINKIIITKPEDPDEPDPKANPDYPVKLDMTVSLSLFIYAATEQPAG